MTISSNDIVATLPKVVWISIAHEDEIAKYSNQPDVTGENWMFYLLYRNIFCRRLVTSSYANVQFNCWKIHCFLQHCITASRRSLDKKSVLSAKGVFLYNCDPVTCRALDSFCLDILLEWTSLSTRCNVIKRLNYPRATRAKRCRIRALEYIVGNDETR